MADARGGGVIWLLLDRTVPLPLRGALERAGVRAIHAGEEELATADARRLLESAIEDECVLVTRNYADFSRLAEAFAHGDRSFPGILFLPAEPAPAADAAAAIRAWVDGGGPGRARDRCVWLEPGPGAAG